MGEGKVRAQQEIPDSPESIQASYYEATASRYDAMHTSDKDAEHSKALAFIDAVSNLCNCNTFLDVGAGTGRGVRFFHEKGRYIRGIEPVSALIAVAESSGLPSGLISQGSGYHLPFENHSFDAVFECGVLHHVKDPAAVVSEMTRVAKRAIFLSDSNRFGQGSPAMRLIKLALYKTHLWNIARFAQTKGKMYHLSEGDGLAYSYSVFDSYAQLASWADRIEILSTASDLHLKSWFHPLLTAPSVLLCALKPECSPDGARK
jgi:ubiquinone/menaquinone biosynthesis C-methylase UbiE